MDKRLYDSHKYDYLHCEGQSIMFSISEWYPQYRKECCCYLCSKVRMFKSLFPEGYKIEPFGTPFAALQIDSERQEQ